MDNLDGSENNAKVADSAYSNSCSNSQSRRSQSSKSTHSGSHSSRSSGYGGKPSTFSDNNETLIEKRSKEKEVKQKKPSHFEKTVEEVNEVEEQPAAQETIKEIILEDPVNVEHTPPTQQVKAEKATETSEKALPETSNSIKEVKSCSISLLNAMTCSAARAPPPSCAVSSGPNCQTTNVKPQDGFTVVISMHDGVVMYTTSSLTATLGFPKDMWIGRSFIDFIHIRDRNTFASHITSGLAVPKIVNGTLNEVPSSHNSVCTMVCRIRRYRNLSNGFGVKERTVAYMPFLLKLRFKNIIDDEGKVIYLVIQATPFYSAFKTPNEVLVKANPFVMRHAANGNIEYIDPESVPYLGFLPQDLEGKDALQLFHIDDLSYLRQIYETIVKEGGVPRSKPYRLMAQNLDFIRVETEWSSFINPWSKKLEFVIGKHHIIEGPTNPDVFQAPKSESQKTNEDDLKEAQGLRDSIIKIMNEALTKPAEVAKQQMSKRCRDIASFMESLIDQHPKPDEELHVNVQDPDSYFERDSVMMGVISPHHENNDSKSSVETPLSYNQLNYNQTLQRYFDSHQPYSYEECNSGAGEHLLGIKTIKTIKGVSSPVARASGISGEISSSESGTGSFSGNSSLVPVGDVASMRLTEILMSKHNADMEKELMKIHRESRSSTKSIRKKAVNENKQKKKEHLARCNASFQPTSLPNPIDVQPHGLKRTSKLIEMEASTHKHHCTTPRQSKKKQPTSVSETMPTSAAVTTTVASSTAAGDLVADGSGSVMNGTYLLGYPPQMPIMSPMAAMPGMYPVYYTPTAAPALAAASGNMANSAMLNNGDPNNAMSNSGMPMQCVMYGQAMYGSPFMYTPYNAQFGYPQPLQVTGNNPLGLATSNYEEACKQGQLKTKTHANRDNWDKDLQFPPSEDNSVETGGTNILSEKQLKGQTSHSTTTNQEYSDGNISSNNTCNRDGENSDSHGTAKMDLCSSDARTSLSTEVNPDTTPSRYSKKGSGEETVDRTDAESSYSSFYSSFFKTESGSASESVYPKSIEKALGTSNTFYEPSNLKTIGRRKVDPPWMEKVCVTSEFIYKYQIMQRNLDEVLKADKLKLEKLEQPSLVNEQLGQLYMDLAEEGEAARLTLEEEVSSAGSSDDEDAPNPKSRRKLDYSKLVMCFEEDAPMPPTPTTTPPPAEVPSTSKV